MRFYKNIKNNNYAITKNNPNSTANLWKFKIETYTFSDLDAGGLKPFLCGI